ncbi:hypothetical protein K1719_029818 [Acacia pycnantha]|nr:hypothetical protein K1719_029818 [Acacia pycnantha]
MGSSEGQTLVERLDLPLPLTGPESLAFDSIGGGPYTGVFDGRLFKFANEGVLEFIYTSPIRNKTTCDGTSDQQETCGRPLGLAFNNRTQEWYIADAYQGLVKGLPFRFLHALDIDPSTGIVYFTEASANYQLKDRQQLLSSRDTSGSLMSYDPGTGQARVLLTNLALAGGVALSADGSFVLVTEFLANRVIRFWLTGPRQNTAQVFMQLPGRPDNIKRNPSGEFWIAIVPLTQLYGYQEVSEVLEYNGELYSGSLLAPYATLFIL